MSIWLHSLFIAAFNLLKGEYRDIAEVFRHRLLLSDARRDVVQASCLHDSDPFRLVNFSRDPALVCLAL